MFHKTHGVVVVIIEIKKKNKNKNKKKKRTPSSSSFFMALIFTPTVMVGPMAPSCKKIPSINI